jgi:hypothetical protein
MSTLASKPVADVNFTREKLGNPSDLQLLQKNFDRME